MPNPYATLENLYALHDSRTGKQLSGDKGQNQGDATKAQYILDTAASEVESVLAGRVPIPLPAPVPLVVTKMVVDIAYYMLFDRRPAAPKEAKQLYDDAKAWLKDFRERRVSLPGIGWACEPQLYSSDRINGSSAFDTMYGLLPSPTGTSKGVIGQPIPGNCPPPLPNNGG